ncbi:MAG TPA: MBL fold metallo-hydrolase [Cytophagales bacterium]|nr:MBL fold metallo-hydrolase [Cytophagales bacterium]
MIQIHSFTFNPFQENTYLLFDETRECVIFDPGCYETYEQQELDDFISTNKLNVVKVINTHCHVDHVLGNQYIKFKYKVNLSIPRLEDQVFKAVKAYAPNYGFNKYDEAEVNEYISENGKILFGNSFLEILFVPGHSPGHLAFYNPVQHFVIAGDVLFNGSIGRTDLPLGDHNTLIESIKTKMYKLPDETIVYPGHGLKTSIGYEKKSNPFVRG